MGKTGFFGLQEIATALGVIIFSILLFSLVSTFQDRGGKTLDDFCARNPALPICKGDTATYVSGIAAYSTEALACGISSVAGGGGQSCLDKFSAEGSNIASANAVSFSGKATEDSKQKTDEFQLPMLDCPASNKYPEIIYKTDDYRSMKFRFNGNSWEYSVYSSFGVGTSYSSFYSVEENAPREYVDYANKAPFSDLIFGLKGDTEELGLKFLAESVNGQKSNYLLFNSAEGNEEEIKTPVNVGEFVSKAKKENQKFRTCTIRAFNLPQEFKEYDIPIIGETDLNWIGVAGDPKYVVYSEIFPQGEDAAWTGQSAWYKDVGNLMFLSFCASHFLGPLVSGGKSAASTVLHPINSVKGATQKLGLLAERIGSLKSTIGEEVYIFGAKDTLKSYLINGPRTGIARLFARLKINGAITGVYGNAENFLQTAGGKLSSSEKEMVKKVFDGDHAAGNIIKFLPGKAHIPILKEAMKDSPNSEKILSIATNALANKKFALYAGADTIASYYMSRTDSEFGKFTDEYPSSIVFDQPMFWKNTRTPYGLQGTKKEVDKKQFGVSQLGVPVIIERPELLSGYTNLVLASPCKADLTLTRGETACGQYTYDTVSGLTQCNTPSSEGYGILKYLNSEPTVKCGELAFQSGLDNKPDALDMIKKLKEVEMGVINEMGKVEPFRDTDGDGKTDTAVDPITGIEFHYNRAENRIDNYKGGSTFGNIGDNRLDEFSSSKCEDSIDYGVDGKHFTCRIAKSSYLDNSLFYDPVIIKNAGGNIFKIYPSLRFDTDESGNPVNINSIVLAVVIDSIYQNYGDVVYIILKDNDGDRKIDQIDHDVVRHGVVDTQSLSSVSYYNFAGDESPDSLIATNCNADAIKVKPNQDPYKTKGQYNYCYQKDYDSAFGVVATTASFAGSALAKTLKIGGVQGWALGTAVDCSLAYLNVKYNRVNWPGSPNK